MISKITCGSIFFNIVVGMGSNSQDLDLREEITLPTWSSVNSANLHSLGTSSLVGMYLGLSLSRSLIFFNFILKACSKPFCQFLLTFVLWPAFLNLLRCKIILHGLLLSFNSLILSRVPNGSSLSH